MSWFEASLICICIFALFSIVYSTLKTGMSPMPSSAKVRKEVLDLLSKQNPAAGQTIIDVGSGWGNLIIPIARKFPQTQVIGYELSLLPWLACLLIKKILRLNNLKLYRQDFLKADIPQDSILTCYLHPRGMKKLKHYLQQREQVASTVISVYFSLPGWDETTFKETRVIRIKDLYQTPVYLYQQS